MQSVATKQNVVIEVGSKQTFRGIWNPKDGLPFSSNGGDVWFINKFYGKFEPGDIIIRNNDNTEWVHLQMNLFTQLENQVEEMYNRLLYRFECLINDKYKELEEKIRIINSKADSFINDYGNRIIEIENKLSYL